MSNNINFNEIKENDIVYVPDGKYKGYIYQVKEKTADNKLKLIEIAKNVKMLKNNIKIFYYNNKKSSIIKNFKINYSNNNSNIANNNNFNKLKIKDIVYIQEGNNKGCIFKIQDINIINNKPILHLIKIAKNIKILNNNKNNKIISLESSRIPYIINNLIIKKSNSKQLPITSGPSLAPRNRQHITSGQSLIPKNIKPENNNKNSILNRQHITSGPSLIPKNIKPENNNKNSILNRQHITSGPSLIPKNIKPENNNKNSILNRQHITSGPSLIPKNIKPENNNINSILKREIQPMTSGPYLIHQIKINMPQAMNILNKDIRTEIENIKLKNFYILLYNKIINRIENGRKNLYNKNIKKFLNRLDQKGISSLGNITVNKFRQNTGYKKKFGNMRAATSLVGRPPTKWDNV